MIVSTPHTDTYPTGQALGLGVWGAFYGDGGETVTVTAPPSDTHRHYVYDIDQTHTVYDKDWRHYAYDKDRTHTVRAN